MTARSDTATLKDLIKDVASFLSEAVKREEKEAFIIARNPLFQDLVGAIINT